MKEYLLGWLIIFACIGICVGLFILPLRSIIVLISIGILIGCHFLAKELGILIRSYRESKKQKKILLTGHSKFVIMEGSKGEEKDNAN